MEAKVYSSKSNANRAATKRYAAEQFTITGSKEGGFMVCVTCRNEQATNEARALGFTTEDLYDEPAAEFAAEVEAFDAAMTAADGAVQVVGTEQLTEEPVANVLDLHEAIVNITFEPGELDVPEYPAPTGDVTPSVVLVPGTDLTTLGQFGLGTNRDDAVCPHCGINHHDNGYATFDDLKESAPDGNPDMDGEHICLGCGGAWGPKPGKFAGIFEGYKAQGHSKCRSLRYTARDYNGGRKSFIQDAVAYGIKEATASANWACMRRGEF